MDIVLSGIRPTGNLHLGNYFGALKNFKKMQYENTCYFFIADWHALTTHYEESHVIAASVWDMVIDWLGAGITWRFGRGSCSKLPVPDFRVPAGVIALACRCIWASFSTHTSG